MSQAGLLMRPVKVKTELNVKSSHTLSENVFLHKNGAILDENSREKVVMSGVFIFSLICQGSWLLSSAFDFEAYSNSSSTTVPVPHIISNTFLYEYR